MNKVYKTLLKNIPKYKEFLTVKELDKNSQLLAEQYPDHVEISCLGYSRRNKPVYCLKIGSGHENALLYGCPHPNEPIGAMMLEYFSTALAESSELREKLDYTFYIIKSIDPDGTYLNEGWFKGPFTLLNYASNFYRPESAAQADWTFPIRYKSLDFNDPIPETKILMALIDKYKPKFIYPLHNAGFGGAYWYMTHNMKDIFDQLYKSCDDVGISINKGEAEMPFVTEYAPGIYKSVGAKQMYDFYEKISNEDPKNLIPAGTSSSEYAEEFYEPVSVITELPYFYDERASDTHEIDDLRIDKAFESFDYQEKTVQFMVSNLQGIEACINQSNPFLNSVKMYLSVPKRNEMARTMMNENEEYQKKATVAETFDHLIMSRFYIGILALGSLYRLSDYELEHNNNLELYEINKLKTANMEAHTRLIEVANELESALDYSFLPIKDLIKIQLETGIIILNHIKES